ncbi:hypothetical protein OEA41_009747 [Lepraria neglecta]|uniref:Uncharacterized protein n=1 Tax=Lepraria neglecta TaxID=209136 RepID=A0AAD9Z2D5_9LECA|nr:hypothetical protein OEA41_009747 [Lepraria neglecta]
MIPTAKPRRKRDAQHAPIPRDSKPEYIEQMRNGKRMEHGAVRRSAGQIYVYQQVAKRTWRGVPVHEWNKQRHKKSTADLASPKTGLLRRGQGVSRRDLGPLRDRAISATTCNLVRTYLVDSGDDPGFSINNVGAELLNAIEALKFPQDDWLFLEAPVVVEVVDTSGKSEGFIYAQTQMHNNYVKMCSEQGTERDALQAALAMRFDGRCASDMRVDLKLLNSGTDGVTNTLYVSTRSVSNSDKSIHPICEAVQVVY